ncbi:polyribonucleotide nucleotidyltransferase 2, mitochondrial isoform X6 [Abrus precatorius]|uniref:polyribonucleotide nucleotidyltransferase n=1 Tax=Abrus precatorius TaxID=3816 RepID=A0A8B8LR09_ABRPR|nr:polyribonucleotide nucleotidyltransferase 2, mitochondrial isoform X6 [Abrus precatorius]
MTRANPLLRTIPHFLTWRALGFRTICSGRLGFDGAKPLETFTEEFEVGSRLITLETGKIARFANGAVVLGMEDTKVLSTVTSAKGDAVRDFLPLTVDYQEKQFAQGVIPTTFMRREGAPRERELLCGRIIDRPIRPLFPHGFYHEVQVMASVLSSDGKQDPDVLAANATSAALMLSDIPWGGPIGMVRIGRICGQFIVNPTMDELKLSDLNLVYACTKDKTLMIDVQAREISEKDLEAGLRLAHPEAVKYLEPQISLAAKAGKSKKEYKLSLLSDRTLEKVRNVAEAPIEAVFTDPSYGKFERGEALDNITQDVKRVLEEEGDEESLKVLSKAVDTVRKKVVRKRVIAEGYRVDGRQLDEVRPLYCEAGYISILHGSALFSRGETQVLCTVTLGAPTPTKRFMLHYSFPPFCINEELLLRKHFLLFCLLKMTFHILFVSTPKSWLQMVQHQWQLYVEGLEDHLGDIDFKIAGTRKGVTAIQLDIKPAGIPLDIICECLEPANKARLQILDHMEQEINAPRNKDDSTSPRLATLKYSNDALRRLIGPMGVLKKKMEDQTGVRMSVGDGTLTIVAKNQSEMDKVLEKIDFIVGREIEVGGVYKGIVTSIKEYGAFVEFNGGQQGLLHISELSHEPVLRVSEVVSVGQKLSLMCIGQDVHGNIKLSLKATLPCPGGLETNDGVQESIASAKKTANVWAPVWNASSTQEQQNSTSELPMGKLEMREAKSPTSQVPVILIRSAAECDEEEKSTSLNKGTQVDNGVQLDHKSKSCRTENVVDSPPKSKSRRSQDVIDSPSSQSGPLPYKNVKKSKVAMQKESKSDFQSPAGDKKETKDKESLTAKDLKLGTKVSAKVYQIRAHGLVLDLGGGLRGMYRFEENGKKDFKIGDVMQVVCSSFSSKGIPVLSSSVADT